MTNENFDNVKADIERAVKYVSSAIHYLDETGHYESNDLDEIMSELINIEYRLWELLNANV